MRGARVYAAFVEVTASKADRVIGAMVAGEEEAAELQTFSRQCTTDHPRNNVRCAGRRN
jgi:hypothetical protein